MNRLTIIVAATKTNGIGQRGRLPWRLAADMAFFKLVTSTSNAPSMNAVLMGRKTWESIPATRRPLANRVNVVISRDPDYQLFPSRPPPSTAAPAYLHADLHSAIVRVSNPDYTDTPPVHRAFVVGGASIYCEVLALRPHSQSAFVDRILLTRILSPAFDECDVFMPDFLAETMVVDGVRLEWTRATHADLQAWVGSDVPEGVQEENGIQFEYQMWVRGH